MVMYRLITALAILILNVPTACAGNENVQANDSSKPKPAHYTDCPTSFKFHGKYMKQVKVELSKPAVTSNKQGTKQAKDNSKKLTTQSKTK